LDVTWGEPVSGACGVAKCHFYPLVNPLKPLVFNSPFPSSPFSLLAITSRAPTLLYILHTSVELSILHHPLYMKKFISFKLTVLVSMVGKKEKSSKCQRVVDKVKTGIGKNGYIKFILMNKPVALLPFEIGTAENHSLPFEVGKVKKLILSFGTYIHQETY
jgi:hypothetical protein